jgi:hypothetical protein
VVGLFLVVVMELLLFSEAFVPLVKVATVLSRRPVHLKEP